MPATPTNAAYLRADAEVFANYSLNAQSSSLRLPASAMSIRAVEAGCGEPVLFLHGFSLCTSHWASLLARLPSLHCIAIDMPGHGASDGFDYEGINLRDWFKDMVTECLDRLGLESVHIVGHSQGAMIGLWLALDAPERVRSVVTIGTPAVALGAQLAGLRILARPAIGSPPAYDAEAIVYVSPCSRQYDWAARARRCPPEPDQCHVLCHPPTRLRADRVELFA